MGKAIGLGQSLNLFSILADNADWDSLDSDTIQKIINDPCQAGREFTAFLKNGGKVIVGEPNIVTIAQNRFRAEKFIGNDWSVFDKETDTRSIAITKLDLTKVRLMEVTNSGTCISGEEWLKHLKALGLVRLDANIFLTLWYNQHLIPEFWKEKNVDGNSRCIFFDGTILRDPDGGRQVLYLYWGDGAWGWNIKWLINDRRDYESSAVIAS